MFNYFTLIANKKKQKKKKKVERITYIIRYSTKYIFSFRRKDAYLDKRFSRYRPFHVCRLEYKKEFFDFSFDFSDLEKLLDKLLFLDFMKYYRYNFTMENLEEFYAVQDEETSFCFFDQNIQPAFNDLVVDVNKSNLHKIFFSEILFKDHIDFECWCSLDVGEPIFVWWLDPVWWIIEEDDVHLELTGLTEYLRVVYMADHSLFNNKDYSLSKVCDISRWWIPVRSNTMYKKFHNEEVFNYYTFDWTLLYVGSFFFVCFFLAYFCILCKLFLLPLIKMFFFSYYVNVFLLEFFYILVWIITKGWTIYIPICLSFVWFMERNLCDDGECGDLIVSRNKIDFSHFELDLGYKEYLGYRERKKKKIGGFYRMTLEMSDDDFSQFLDAHCDIVSQSYQHPRLKYWKTPDDLYVEIENRYGNI